MTGEDADLLAAEYVLGTLDGRERDAVATLAASRPALKAAIAAWDGRLEGLCAGGDAAPSPDLWGRIEARLDALPEQGAHLARGEDGVWLDFLPGVQVKLLRENEDETQTFLLKLAPGAWLPPHDHPHGEECYMLEGEMRIDHAVFRAGDYLAYPSGLPHLALTTSIGATILIRGQLPG